MLCEMCGQEMRTVPAGISKKTGKPYDSFMVCSDRQCGWKPPKGNGSPEPQKPQIKPLPPQRTLVSGGNGNPEMMRLAYKKDLLVALIEKYGETTDILQLFDAYWKHIENENNL